ncbi:hypothetical protein L798_12286 [Zootermopsis nevadensis]|uniref:Uncharacterized protein n=1 Tax=Zootermopsis nevadensis TaxID=136037 RepID=A0A067QUM1_ZOONE|nr:hypothetical protein L798_12286 [Zootermopsis nevadensis]
MVFVDDRTQTEGKTVPAEFLPLVTRNKLMAVKWDADENKMRAASFSSTLYDAASQKMVVSKLVSV